MISFYTDKATNQTNLCVKKYALRHSLPYFMRLMSSKSERSLKHNLMMHDKVENLYGVRSECVKSKFYFRVRKLRKTPTFSCKTRQY